MNSKKIVIVRRDDVMFLELKTLYLSFRRWHYAVFVQRPNSMKTYGFQRDTPHSLDFSFILPFKRRFARGLPFVAFDFRPIAAARPPVFQLHPIDPDLRQPRPVFPGQRVYFSSRRSAASRKSRTRPECSKTEQTRRRFGCFRRTYKTLSR